MIARVVNDGNDAPRVWYQNTIKQKSLAHIALARWVRHKWQGSYQSGSA
jgi:hypothetical protein